MNPETVKTKLESLGIEAEPFELIFSGKASKKVNGLYKPATKEILIHNKNFQNDNALMYTALHEYVHHIACTRKLVKSRSAHPALFWALFHSTIEIAVEKGVYNDPFDTDPELTKQGQAVMDVLKAQVEAQRKLGSALAVMEGLCTAKGARFEDYLDRHVRIPRQNATAAIEAQLAFDFGEDVSPQAVELVVSCKDHDARSEAKARIEEGHSIQQVRASVKQGKIIDPRVDPVDDEPSDEETLHKLVTQRKRMSVKLRDLKSEIEATDKMIESLKERLPHLAFDDDLDYEVVDDDEEDDDDENGGPE